MLDIACCSADSRALLETAIQRPDNHKKQIEQIKRDRAQLVKISSFSDAIERAIAIPAGLLPGGDQL